MRRHIATALIPLDATLARVWRVLTDPALISRYLDAVPHADWRPGGRIAWVGVRRGRPFVDAGRVVHVDAEGRLEFTHSGQLFAAGVSAARSHAVVYTLATKAGGVQLGVELDNLASPLEKRLVQSEWRSVLERLKRVAEDAPTAG